MVRVFNKLIQPYARRIRLTVSRGIVRLVSDALKLQEVQIALLADETRDGVERFQNYGLTSVPLSGAEGVFLSVGGSRDHGIVIAIDDRRYRLKDLQAGEVALYDDQGQVIKLKRGKAIEITGCDTLTATCAVSATITAPKANIIASTKITLTTPLLDVSGNIKVGGDITAVGDVTAADVTVEGLLTTAAISAAAGLAITTPGAISITGLSVAVSETGA